jgi:hypothetical protein
MEIHIYFLVYLIIIIFKMRKKASTFLFPPHHIMN